MHDVSIGTAPRYNPYFRPTPCRAMASMPEDSNAGCSRAVTVSLEEEDIEGATLDELLETDILLSSGMERPLLYKGLAESTGYILVLCLY